MAARIRIALFATVASLISGSAIAANSVEFDQRCYECGDSVRIQVFDAVGSLGSVVVDVFDSAGSLIDSEAGLSFTPVSTGLYAAEVPASCSLPPVFEDGIFEVEIGSSLVAMYDDSTEPPVFATANIESSDCKVLILQRTLMSPGLFHPENEQTLAAECGYGADIVDDAQWGAMSKADFDQYRAIVLGDISTAAPHPWQDPANSDWAAPLANRTTWSDSVRGHRIFIMAGDPVFHQELNPDGNGLGAGRRLVKNALCWVAGGSDTGLYVVTGSKFHGAPPGTPLDLLDQLGNFVMDGGASDIVQVVNSPHPSLNVPDPVTEVELENWGQSSHGAIRVPLPTGFLEIARRGGDQLPYIVVSSPSVSFQSQYCITGTSTGVGYSWWIDVQKDGVGFNAGDPSGPSVPPSATGSSATTLAEDFATSIDATSATAVPSGSCFTISNVGPTYSLLVGPADKTPSCVVTSSGCAYNPIITLVVPSVPALRPIGALVLLMLLAAAGALVVKGRTPIFGGSRHTGRSGAGATEE